MPPRVFLDWTSPFLPALTSWLLQQAAGPGTPDLSGLVVVLPTAQTGRRLREALAMAAGETGLLSPGVVTAEVLIRWGTENLPGVAGRGETITAWASVLQELPLDQWRALFPIDPVSQDTAWAVQAAGDLLKLRRTLEEGARSIAMAAGELGPTHPEAARWQALSRLETLATRRLEDAGWQDSLTVRLAAAAHPVLPDGVKQVVVAGVPDSIRLVRQALESMVTQNKAAVTVIIHAPEGLADQFDAWGRPLPAYWTQCEIALPRGTDSISLVARPEDAAKLLSEKLSLIRQQPGAASIGTADAEVSPPLKRQADSIGIPIFDPEGVPLLEHELSWLMHTLTQLLHTGAWTAAGQLLRVPDVLAAAGRAMEQPGHFTDGLRILREWDEFQSARLPQTLSQALPLAVRWADDTLESKQARLSHPGPGKEPTRPVLPGIIAWLQAMLADLNEGPLPERLEAFLATLYHERRFATGLARNQFTTALTAWHEAVLAVERGATGFLPALPVAARMELAAGLVREVRLYSGHPPDAPTLHGWLELAWQDTPDLIVAGLNEGLVPDSVQGDAWLPDSVRGILGLKTNGSRLARDSYLLSAMIASRREEGSIQLIACRMNAAGDPLKPSRLLLRCLPSQLPERALRLFPKEIDEPAKTAAPSWKRAWALKVPPPVESALVFQRLSVSAISDYLKCPFRFYLKHVLRMEEYDASVAELDARAFGSLFHDTMQQLHQDPQLRDSTDAAVLTAFLHHGMERMVAETFGTRLTIPVALQMDTLRGCLTKAAEIHAAERAAGWRFKEVEIEFPKLPGSDEPVRIKGVEIRGRIDLIEEHPELGLRILDYKTSARAISPFDAHLKKGKLEEDDAEWKFCSPGGRRHVWHNLQLPLYAHIMSGHYERPVAVGYVNLPRAISEARLEMWPELTPEILDAAYRCAEGVVQSVRAGLFWPPSSRLRYDDFGSLIFDDAAWSFDSVQLKRIPTLIASGHFHPGPSRP